MRTRRPALLLLAAAFACGPSGAYADEPSSPPPVARVPTSSSAISSERGRAYDGQISSLETDVVALLTGKPEASALTLAELDARRAMLKASLANDAVPSGERESLEDRLDALEQLLARGKALAGTHGRLDPKLVAIMRRAAVGARPLDALEQITNQLVAAASARTPAAARAVFDNMRRGLGADADSTLAPVEQLFAARGPITFTPPTDPRTNRSRSQIRGVPTPPQGAAPAPPPAGPSTVDQLAAAAFAAYRPFRMSLPDAGTAEFASRRASLLGELTQTARDLETSLGGDPSRYANTGQLVAHLEALENVVERQLGFSVPVKETDLPTLRARLDAVARSGQYGMAELMRELWNYRFYLATSVAQRQVPVGTRFARWELCPNRLNADDAVVEAIENNGQNYYGLRYEKSAGRVTQLVAFTADQTRVLEINRAADDTRTVSVAQYGGAGGARTLLSQLFEKYDAQGRLQQRQAEDVVHQLLTTTTFDAQGRERVQTDDEAAHRPIHIVDHTAAVPYEFNQEGNDQRITILDQHNQVAQQVSTDVNGTVSLNYIDLRNGTRLKTTSEPDIMASQIKDANDHTGRTYITQGWIVNLTEARKGDAQRLNTAREALRIAGIQDRSGNLARELSNFMRDHISDPLVSFGIIPPAGAGLPPMFQMTRTQSGRSQVVSGYFGMGGGYQGAGREMAFLAYWPSGDVDGAGTTHTRGDSSHINYEYLSDGSRLFDDSPEKRDIPAPLWRRLWSDSTTEYHYLTTRQTYSLGQWSDDSRGPYDDPARTRSQTNEGTAWGSQASAWIGSVPGLSHVMGASDQVSRGLSDPLIHGSVYQMLAADHPDVKNVDEVSDCAQSVACSGFARPDPLNHHDEFVTWFTDKILPRLTAAGRRCLDDAVRTKLRPSILFKNGITASDGVRYQMALQSPITIDEEYMTLVSYFGSAHVAEQIGEYYGMAAGLAAGLTVEGLKMVTNPMMWLPMAGELLGPIVAKILQTAGVSTRAIGIASTTLKWAGRAAIPLMAMQPAVDFLQGLSDGNPRKLTELPALLITIKVMDKVNKEFIAPRFPDLGGGYRPPSPLETPVPEPVPRLPDVRPDAPPPPPPPAPPPASLPPAQTPPPATTSAPPVVTSPAPRVSAPVSPEIPQSAPPPANLPANPLRPPEVLPQVPHPEIVPPQMPQMPLRVEAAPRPVIDVARVEAGRLGTMSSDLGSIDAPRGTGATTNVGASGENLGSSAVSPRLVADPIDAGAAGPRQAVAAAPAADAGGGATPAASAPADVPIDPARAAPARALEPGRVEPTGVPENPNAGTTPRIEPPVRTAESGQAPAPADVPVDPARAPELSPRPAPEGGTDAGTPRPEGGRDGNSRGPENGEARPGATDPAGDGARNPTAQPDGGSLADTMRNWTSKLGRSLRSALGREEGSGAEDPAARARETAPREEPTDSAARERPGERTGADEDAAKADEAARKKAAEDEAARKKAAEDEAARKKKADEAKKRRSKNIRDGAVLAMASHNAMMPHPQFQPSPPDGPFVPRHDPPAPPGSGGPGPGTGPGGGPPVTHDDPQHDPTQDSQRDPDSDQQTTNQQDPGQQQTVASNQGAPGKILPPPFSGAGGGSGNGAVPNQQAPNVKMPGGSKGGAGGGAGGGGGGAGGGAAGARPAVKAPAGAADAPIDVAAPAGAVPAPFAPAALAPRKSAATPNAVASLGGHSVEPSLASRFDGSRDGGRAPAAASGGGSMRGIGGGDSIGLPTLAARPVKPADAADAAPKDATAASAEAPASAPLATAAAVGAAPEGEDYNYTYLAPARHRYELPDDPDFPKPDWRYFAMLAARVAAALAAAYLVTHSDFGYLVGFARRRRDQ
jgi:hypothetical protein